MPLILRPAEPADLQALVTLMNSAYRGSGPESSWNSEAECIEGDRTSEAGLINEIASKPKACLLVARKAQDAPVVGCVLLAPLGEGLWHMGSLAIDPLLQRAGLGRELLATAELWAAERGATRMEIEVVNVRDTLIAWYERRGYRPTGSTNPFPYGDSRFGTPLRDDLCFVVLEKSLSSRASQG